MFKLILLCLKTKMIVTALLWDYVFPPNKKVNL